MKLHFSQSSHPDSTEGPITLRESILNDIEKTRFALETAYKGFDYVTDPDLIDCYIYEVNSLQKRYKYLLGQAALLNSQTITAADNTETIIMHAVTG